MNALQPERLRELLEYFPETGQWRWRVTNSMRAVAGSIAGYTDHRGYVYIGVDGVVYLAHRLAHLYMTGEWPPDQIDHENTNKNTNRWDNLRPATNQQNHGNMGKHKDNTSGFKNVYYRRGRRMPWLVQIMARGELFHIGTFATAEEADVAAGVARQELFGEFSRG